MVQQKYNQKGMSAILFAMIFTIILSLLAVGFATLVRNDQRQTLDQSLGYQAQYAAESAVNQVSAMLKANPAAVANANCNAFNVESANAGVKVTCVTWDTKADTIILEPVTEKPKSTRIEPDGSIDRLVITWTSDITAPGTYTTGGGFPNTINPVNYPIMRYTYMPDSAPGSPKQIYFVPVTGGAGQVNSQATIADGSVAEANCNASSCTMTVLLGGQNSGYLAIAALGRSATRVTITAYQGSNKVKLLNAQYTIDATAIAQDITKRVQARIPFNSQTWRPAYAAAANKMCKDIKIDGNNNNTSISGGAVCP